MAKQSDNCAGCDVTTQTPRVILRHTI